MKKLFLAGVALTALAADPAMAADIARPVYKAPPPVIAVFSCTGCYVGGHIGGLWARKEWRSPGDTFFATLPAGANFGSHDADSWLGGV
jgi:outer membrane immunogenic protein